MSDSLKKYREKRNFGKTPEPPPKKAKAEDERYRGETGKSMER